MAIATVHRRYGPMKVVMMGVALLQVEEFNEAIFRNQHTVSAFTALNGMILGCQPSVHRLVSNLVQGGMPSSFDLALRGDLRGCHLV